MNALDLPDRPDVQERARSRHGLPSAAELAALTGDRDRVVDLIRIVSLLVVIVGHSVMLTVDVPAGHDGAIVLGNLLADLPALQWLTWVLQIMPLFFFAGAAAAMHGFMRADDRQDVPTAGQWLLARAQRLFRPVFWYLLAVGGLLAVLTGLGAQTVADVVAHLGVQLLWFLGAYLLVLAPMPLWRRITRARSIHLAVAACWALTAAVDVVRLHWDVDALGYLNFLTVWSIPAILGVAYARRLLRPWAAAALGVAAFVIDVVLVRVGPYEVSLVTVPGQHLSNMSPPSLLLAGHAVMLCCAAIACRGVLAMIAASPRLWWWVAFGNRGAMTLYLWHLPMLCLIVGASQILGITRAGPAEGASFGVVVVIQTLLLVAGMVPVLFVLAGLENTPLPWWDVRRARRAGRVRDTVVLTATVAAALGVLMLARTGLGAEGLGWLAFMLAGVIVARVVSVPGHADRG